MHGRRGEVPVTVRVTTLKGAAAGAYYVEALPAYYLDADGDGFGDPFETDDACAQPEPDQRAERPCPFKDVAAVMIGEQRHEEIERHAHHGGCDQLSP